MFKEDDTNQSNEHLQLVIEDYLLLLFFWVLGIIVFAQFFFRYVLGNPLGWTEEIARYMLILVTFLGAIVAVRKQTHIAVGFFYRFFNISICRIFSGLIDLIQVAFFAYLAWQAHYLTSIATQEMSSIPLPKSLIYWGLLFCFVLMSVRAAIVFAKHIKNPNCCPLISIRLDYLKEKQGDSA